MSSIRKQKNGKHQADYQNKFRNIKRTKRTFDTKKEAEAWIEAVGRDATARLLGHKRRRLFGEALAKYLREESPRKASSKTDIGNARTLRWPIWDEDDKRWLRLEETPLEDVPAVLQKWAVDLRQVIRRVYVGNQIYHLRSSGSGEVWYHQPGPGDDGRPPVRTKVTDAALIRTQIERAPGRGPFSSGTLRARQLLVRRILFMAWKFWGTDGDPWLTQDVSSKIQLDAKPLPREEYLEGYDKLRALLIAAPCVEFALAILGAAWIGWRRSNLLRLEWPNVVFPVFAEKPDGTMEEVQPGYIWTARKNVKRNRRPIVYPMVPHIEQLFRFLWESRAAWRDHHYVFHRGDGRPFLEFRKMWMSTKRRAGIDPGFRWNGLRHTWTSWLLQGGGHSKQVAELGGWADTQMVDRVYGHINTDHLRTTARLSNRVN